MIIRQIDFTSGVNSIKLYKCKLQVKPLFERLKTIATLVNCKCKRIIELTPD